MTRLFASMLAIAVAICFSMSAGCGGDTKKGDGKKAEGGDKGKGGDATFVLSSDKGELTLEKDKVAKHHVVVKTGEAASVEKVSDAKIDITIDTDKKGITIVADKDAKAGDYAIKIKSKDDKTVTYNLKVNAAK